MTTDTATKKAQLGQFMTKNSNFILQGMTLPKFKGKYIEPFAGQGHLVDFLIAHKISQKRIDCYDIEPKKPYIQSRDSLLNPIDYTNTYVITNPPYLARNKSNDKAIFNQYGLNDLYKCFLKQLIDCPPIGGILIIPLNFWSSIRSMDVQLRKQFLEKFSIQRLNIFEEQVFEDTSYNICAFQFINKPQKTPVAVYFIPSNDELYIELNDENHYTFGGDIYTLPMHPEFRISRLTRINREESKPFTTGIIVKCIDDGKDESQWFHLKYTEEPLEIEKYTDCTKDLTFRSFAVLVIEPAIDSTRQQQLVEEFNNFLQTKRKETRSLFLTNYRDKYRKRISFELVYRIVSNLLIKNK